MRELRDIHFIDPDDTEFKGTIENSNGSRYALWAEDDGDFVSSAPTNTARAELHSTITRTRVAQVFLHASLRLVK